MQFTAVMILLVCSCVAIPRALGASIYENLELANVQQQLNELKAELEHLKEDESLAQVDDSSQPKPGWSDAILFNSNDRLFQQEAVFVPERKELQTEKVLLYTTDVDAAIDEVTSMGGTVPLTLGDDLLIAKLPADKVKSHFQTASTHIPETASPQTLKYVKAYWKSIEAVRKQQSSPPVALNKTLLLTGPEALLQPPSTSKPHARPTMTGHITAIILIVSGPGALAITDDEVDQITSGVVDGCSFWSDQAPASASLRFTIRRAIAYINVADSTICTKDWTICERRFGIPALRYLGYSSTSQLEQNVIQQTRVDGAYTTFFSKYKQGHFAYAYLKGGPIFMQYPFDGWGPDRINVVFAHETGHVFNAPDEHDQGVSCDCRRNYGLGKCSAPNSNCKTCSCNQEDCIMTGRENNMKVCPYTRRHIGWCD